MLKVNDLLDKTSKTVSSIAAISLSLAVIAVSSVVVKENLKELLSLRKIKAHVICVKSVKEDAIKDKEASNATLKKASSKKVSTKVEPSKEATSEEKSK